MQREEEGEKKKHTMTITYEMNTRKHNFWSFVHSFTATMNENFLFKIRYQLHRVSASLSDLNEVYNFFKFHFGDSGCCG